MSKTSKGCLFVIAAALCWSCGGVFLKFIDADIWMISSIRYLTGFIGIVLLSRSLPVFFIRDQEGKISRNDTILLWLGAFVFVICSFLYVVANRMTTAANAIFLQYTNPVWIIILGPFILKEKNTLIDYLTIIGVFAGMLLFFANELKSGTQNIDSVSMTGNIMAIISGFFMAFYTMLMRKQKNGSSVYSSMLSQLMGAIIFLPFLFTEKLPSTGSIVFITLTGLINGSMAVFFYPLGLKYIPALSASLISVIEPLTNPLWVFIFAGEKPSFLSIIGGILILTFVAIRTVIQLKKEKSLKEAADEHI